MLPLMNHFAYTAITSSILIPDATDIDTTNSPSKTKTGALGLHAQTCQQEWNKKPVFILVDFWDRGPAIETADNLNEIKPDGRITETAVGTSSSPGGPALGSAMPLLGLLAAAALAV